MAARDVEKAAQALAEAQTCRRGAGADRRARRPNCSGIAFGLSGSTMSAGALSRCWRRAKATWPGCLAACQRAKQRCESLERLREKTQRAHERSEADAERKLIDELATTRFNIDNAASGFNRTGRIEGAT